MLLSGFPARLGQRHAGRARLKVSQFVALMGDEQTDRAQDVLMQSEARDRIRRLVERLRGEYASAPPDIPS